MKEAPYIAQRHLSLFTWGRPPIPWGIADIISNTLKEHNIKDVGLTGSLSPSIIVALGCENKERLINAFASRSLWDEGTGWNYMIEDSPGMEKDLPFINTFLPSINLDIWDGATPFFGSNALFIDLPLSHPSVNLDIKWINERDHELLFLGFLEEYSGPLDVKEWALKKGYEFKVHKEKIFNEEDSKSLEYTLVICSNRGLI